MKIYQKSYLRSLELEFRRIYFSFSETICYVDDFIVKYLYNAIDFFKTSIRYSFSFTLFERFICKWLHWCALSLSFEHESWAIFGKKKRSMAGLVVPHLWNLKVIVNLSKNWWQLFQVLTPSYSIHECIANSFVR